MKIQKPVVTPGGVTRVTIPGIAEASIYTVKNGDRTVFTISWNVGKQRHRRTGGTLEAAVFEAKRVVTEIAKGRSSAVAMPVSKLEYFRHQELLLGDVPLHEAVRFYLDHVPHQESGVDLGTVIKEYLASVERRAAQRDSTVRWCDTLKSRLGQLSVALTPEVKIGSLTFNKLEGFVYKNKWSVGTRFNMTATIRGLFRFAQRRGFLPAGESAASQMEDIVLPTRTPQVLNPSELRDLLALAEAEHSDLVPYITIGAFAGARSSEIMRLRWEEHFDFDEGLIFMPCEITKTGQRRVVEMNATLRSWLTAYRQGTGKVCPANPYYTLPQLVAATRISWPHNALRHSFVSYELARTKNPQLVALGCGHSVSTLNTHYKQLVTPTAAKEWFILSPTKVAPCLAAGV